MIDPTRHRQLMELDAVNLCTEILQNARNELYMNMRFLDVSLSCLGYEAAGSQTIGTDGFLICYQPDYLMRLYQRGRTYVNRAYLHMVFHGLFCHMDTRGAREKEYWNLACDIAMESVLDDMYKKCIHVPQSALRRETYLWLKKEIRILTAENIYEALKKKNMTKRRFQQLAAEFLVDDHSLWYEEDSRKQATPRQNQWNDNREKMQVEMEAFAKEASEDSKSLMEQVQVENRERYDYKRFLRKFAVLREEAQVDNDSFDYVFYSYGLSMYGNMPLIEPLETSEISRIEDFALVIDTSMSCSGDLVRRFLEETYSVLCESESYFKKIHIHIIQCDDKIQSDQVITSRDEMEAYMKDFTIIGQGGTDFRLAFEYVSQLIHQGAFRKLKGLLYFTDGKGIYPVQCPPYDTAFVFVQDHYEDVSVPSWAMKLILEPEEIGARETIE